MLQRIIIIIFLLGLCSVSVDAQFFKIFKKKKDKAPTEKQMQKSEEKRKKEFLKEEEKRKADSIRFNVFNPLQEMGEPIKEINSEFIWTYETAHVVKPKHYEVTIVTPIRVGLPKDMEIGTSILGLPFIPTVFLKKMWWKEKIYISSRHQIYSYFPLLYYGKKSGNANIFPVGYDVPQSVAVKNELIVSKSFKKPLKCGGASQTYAVYTAGLSIDYGFANSAVELNSLPNRFLNTRSPLALGGYMASMRVQADYYLNRVFFLTLAARGIYSDNDVGFTFEHNLHIKYAPNLRLYFNLGYWTNFSSGSGSFIIPVFDIGYFFGSKGRATGLFNAM